MESAEPHDGPDWDLESVSLIEQPQLVDWTSNRLRLNKVSCSCSKLAPGEDWEQLLTVSDEEEVDPTPPPDPKIHRMDRRQEECWSARLLTSRHPRLS